jgi:hypothetical protein
VAEPLRVTDMEADDIVAMKALIEGQPRELA